MTSLIKNEAQQISLTKLGLIVLGVAQGILSSGINIIPASTIDETILKLCVIVGGVLAGIGARDALTKTKGGEQQ